jgi:NAD-dependent SIR2 family protein deacetylase
MSIVRPPVDKIINRLRSFLGYPHVRDAVPNPTHYALAALQYSGHVPRLVTQNVDGLHKRALGGIWTKSKTDGSIVELHGTLHVRSQLYKVYRRFIVFRAAARKCNATTGIL